MENLRIEKECPYCGEKSLHKLTFVDESGLNIVSVESQITPSVNKSRGIYIVLGIFLGELGVHNFYAGYSGKGIAQLLITILAGWLIIPLIAVVIWVIIELCTVELDAAGHKFV